MRKPKRKRLGLDVSSKQVGFAVFHDTTLASYGKFQPKGTHHGAKLKSFYDFLLSLFQTEQPDDVILEMPFRSGSYGVLSMYIGVVLMAHADVLDRDLPDCQRMRSVDVKRALHLPLKQSHTQHKRNMLKRMNSLYGLRLRFRKHTKRSTSDDDIADAIALVHVWMVKQGILDE